LEAGAPADMGTAAAFSRPATAYVAKLGEDAQRTRRRGRPRYGRTEVRIFAFDPSGNAQLRCAFNFLRNSCMFGTIRRHQNWLWFIVVAVVIVSFVVYFDPSQRGSQGGGRRGSTSIGEIDGHQITPQEFRDAQQETRLLYFLNFRKWPEQDETASQRGFDLEREATMRLVRVEKANQAGIQVADNTVAELAKRLLGELPVEKFEKEILTPNGLTLIDFERFVRNDARLQQLSSVYGLAGRMVTPAEAEEAYRREHAEVAGELVFFNLSNYVSRITVTNSALTQYYSNAMARYRTPEQVRVSYVEFPATNFLAEAEKQFATVTNLNMKLEEAYYKHGTNEFKDEKGNVLSKDKAIEKIKADERLKLAGFYARKAANEFANKVYDEATKGGENQPVNPAVLDTVAKAANFKVQITPPFDMQDPPTNINVGPNFTRAAFSLNATNNPIAFQPVDGEDAFFVIALKDTVPSRLQPYEEVKAKVETDYKQMQAFQMLRQEAMLFHDRVTNELAQGKSFAEAAAKSNLKVITLPPISQSTETLTNLEVNVNIRQLRSLLFSLEAGQATSFMPNPPDGGFIAYAKQRLPIDEAKMKTELPKFTAEMRYSRQNEVFNNWFRKQVEKAAPGLPTLNRQQPRSGARG
jgi:hypothetical protein